MTASRSLAPLHSAARNGVLFLLLGVAMFGNYYVYDSIAPLADLLASERGFTATEIGALNAVYSLPNVVMVLAGGIVVDRFGATRSVALFAAVCALGSVATALLPSFGGMVAGRLLFGIGAESMIVGITTVLGQWFGAGRLGLVLGLNLSIARAGSYAADLSPAWADALYREGVAAPLLLAAGLAAASFVAALGAYWLDRTARRAPPELATARTAPFAWSAVRGFGRDYWLLVAVCVAIYAVFLPFRSTFAIQFFQDVHGLTRAEAGALNGSVFLAAIVATPLFGWLFDRSGRRSAALVFGGLALLPVFPILAEPALSPWIANVLLGLSYALVPAVLWPCVARLVEERRLGTAYGLMTMLQNVGLAAFNLLAGALNDASGAGARHPEGYRPMLALFTASSFAAVLAAWSLHRHRGSASDRLETA